MAFIVYQLGSVIFLCTPFGAGATLAIIILALLICLLLRKPYKQKTDTFAEGNNNISKMSA
jgi:hypothetical protein